MDFLNGCLQVCQSTLSQGILEEMIHQNNKQVVSSSSRNFYHDAEEKLQGKNVAAGS